MANTYKSLAQDGSGGLDYGIVPVAMAQALQKLQATLVAAARVTNYSEAARVQGTQFGGSVRVPALANIAAVNKVPGTPVTPIAAPLTKEDIPINKHKTWDIMLEDYGVLFNQSILTDYLVSGALSIAEAIEADVLGVYPDAGRVIGAPGSGMSVARLTELNRLSMQDKWRQTFDKTGVLGPNATEDLLNEAKFTDADRAGTANAQINGYLGRKFTFDLVTSNLVASIANSPGAEHNLFFQREGIGLAFIDLSASELPAEIRNSSGVFMDTQVWADDMGNPIYTLRMIVGYNQENRGWMLTVDTIYGVAVVRDTLVYDVLV